MSSHRARCGKHTRLSRKAKGTAPDPYSCTIHSVLNLYRIVMKVTGRACGWRWRPVVALYNNNAYGRTAEDVRCAPMPPPVFDLGVQLWLAALPFLCEASRSAPPTHCQLLFYHCLFDASMGECAHEGCTILPSPHVCSWPRTTVLCAVAQDGTMTTTPSSTHVPGCRGWLAQRAPHMRARRTRSASVPRCSCTQRATPQWTFQSVLGGG
jgi:hypothetical protein